MGDQIEKNKLLIGYIKSLNEMEENIAALRRGEVPPAGFAHMNPDRVSNPPEKLDKSLVKILEEAMQPAQPDSEATITSAPTSREAVTETSISTPGTNTKIDPPPLEQVDRYPIIIEVLENIHTIAEDEIRTRLTG